MHVKLECGNFLNVLKSCRFFYMNVFFCFFLLEIMHYILHVFLNEANIYE